MIKEQTPITAEKLKETILPKMYCYLGSGMLTNKYNVDVANQNADDCIQLIEQYANAKVLEVLKRDLKDLSDCYKAHAEDNPRKEVCQVLHTLIMEKQEQIAQAKQK